MKDNKNQLFENQIWMNTEEAAGYLRITVNSLRIKVCRKSIRAFHCGRHLRFKKSDLDQYLKPAN